MLTEWHHLRSNFALKNKGCTTFHLWDQAEAENMCAMRLLSFSPPLKLDFEWAKQGFHQLACCGCYYYYLFLEAV